jgi:Uri superfamily endonuclease
MALLASCNPSRNTSAPSDGTNRESGFDLRADSIAEERAHYLHQEKKQKFELDWLKLRTRVVQAQFVTNQARLAENTLAQEMARDSLTRFSEKGGIRDCFSAAKRFLKRKHESAFLPVRCANCAPY